MSRRAVLKVVKAKYTSKAPWMVRVPPRLQRTEGAQKKFFTKESIAKAYVERLARQLGDYHSQALGLSDRQKLEASECYWLLERHDASLLDAVRHYLTYLDQTKRSIPVSELFDEFLSVKQQDNVSPKYLADLRSKLGRFVNSSHDTLVCNLTVAQIEAWIRSLDIGTVSRESYRRNVSVLLEFGRRRGYLSANPAADIKIRGHLEGEVSILTPDELRNLLEKCAPEIVPYHCMFETTEVPVAHRNKSKQSLRSSADGSAERSRRESSPSRAPVPRPTSELADGTCRTSGAGCPFSTRPFQRLCRLRETCDANSKPRHLRCETASAIRQGFAGWERGDSGASSSVALVLRFASYRGECPTTGDSRPPRDANQRRRRLRHSAHKIQSASASTLFLRDLLTVEEAAERLRLSPETVRKLVGMCDRFSE